MAWNAGTGQCQVDQMWADGIDVDEAQSGAAIAACNAFVAAAGTPAPGAPAPTPRPPTIADVAFGLLQQVDAPDPVPNTKPDFRQDHPSITGLPTWLWVTGVEPVERTAASGGLTVTATATPVRTEWALDDVRFECDGLGVAYPGENWKEPPCGHFFTDVDPRVDGRVAVVWELAWRASNGATGSFGTARTRHRFDLRVVEYYVTTD